MINMIHILLNLILKINSIRIQFQAIFDSSVPFPPQKNKNRKYFQNLKKLYLSLKKCSQFFSYDFHWLCKHNQFKQE